MKYFIVFIVCIFLYSFSHSQSHKEKTKDCDTPCAMQKLGIAAVPATAALGFNKLVDVYGISEREIYTGISGQPMTEKEILRTIGRINEQKVFERSNYIIVNNNHINTKDYTVEAFKLKLDDYSVNKNGVHRIAIKNLRLVRGGGMASAILATSIFLFFNDASAASEVESVTDSRVSENAIRPDFNSKSWARPKTNEQYNPREAAKK